jgi:hypothetical protein
VLIGAFSLGVLITIGVLLALQSNVTEADVIRLVDDINNENREVRDKARAEMRRLGPDAVPHLRKILFPTLGDKIRRVFGLQPRRSTPALRKINAISSCEFVGESAVPILLAFTTTRDADIRVVAVGTLSVVRAEHAKVVPALVEYLSDSEGLVRYLAIQGLVQYGSNAAMALPSLRRLTNDADPSVRRVALAALDRIRN